MDMSVTWRSLRMIDSRKHKAAALAVLLAVLLAGCSAAQGGSSSTEAESMSLDNAASSLHATEGAATNSSDSPPTTAEGFINLAPPRGEPFLPDRGRV
jgi:hypothetical protein